MRKINETQVENYLILIDYIFANRKRVKAFKNFLERNGYNDKQVQAIGYELIEFQHEELKATTDFFALSKPNNLITKK
jgi:hypothetical protein